MCLPAMSGPSKAKPFVRVSCTIGSISQRINSLLLTCDFVLLSTRTAKHRLPRSFSFPIFVLKVLESVQDSSRERSEDSWACLSTTHTPGKYTTGGCKTPISDSENTPTIGRNPLGKSWRGGFVEIMTQEMRCADPESVILSFTYYKRC